MTGFITLKWSGNAILMWERAMWYSFKSLLLFPSCVAFVLGTTLPIIAIAEAQRKISDDTVTLSRGEALMAELKSKQPAPISQVSFSIKSMDNSDPSANSQVPLTIEVYERNNLIGSESFTSDLGNNFRKIHVEVNNEPTIQDDYKIVIRFDAPEFNGDDNIIQIDPDTIHFNNEVVRMDLDTKVSVVSEKV